MTVKDEVIPKILNELWDGVIKNIGFNLITQEISFAIETNDNGIKNNYQLEFKKVSSHYFIKNTGTQRFNLFEYDEGDFLELTSISYYPQGLGKIKICSNEEWIKQWFSNANIAIEIWSSMLFIEAKTMVLNKVSYDLVNPEI